MQYDQKQFTQAGLNMFSNALSNKQSITVDKVIVDDLPTNNFSNLALLSLDSFADAMSFQANYTETSNNTLTVDAVMSNKGFQSPYTVQEIGLVGHIGTDESTQTLIAILVASDPFTLPAQQNNETPSQFIPNITIQLANDDMGQVPVMVSNDAYIAQKDLDNLVAKNGYIKLTDADNRYVKQGDFQNEVNNSVNEKADQSDVDQQFSQANAHADQNYSNAVHDNHDGTVQVNGNNMSLTQTIEPCDLNSITTSGFYSSSAPLSQYQNIPSNVFTGVGFNLIVTTNESGTNGTIQELRSAGMDPLFRKHGWNFWFPWEQYATTNQTLQQIPLPVMTRFTDGYQSVRAFYDITTHQITLMGYYQCTNGHEMIQIDCSNIKKYFNSNIKLTTSYFNEISVLQNYPQSIEDDHFIRFYFNTGSSTMQSFDTVTITVDPV